MNLPERLQRNSDSHKGDYGHVLVVGGSTGMTGAVCLCARSALKVGAGLVTVGVPKKLNNIIETKLTEIMSVPLKQTGVGSIATMAITQIYSNINRYTVLAIGCGGSRNKSTAKLFRKLITDSRRVIVADADAINAFVGKLKQLTSHRANKLVLTPHIGEFAKLIGKSNTVTQKMRKTLAKEFALKYNLILVLKGNKTIVTDGVRFYENNTGNPGMATAGTGDCLTGIIAGLISQGIEEYDAACLAVYMHGLSGDLAVAEKTQYCLIAGDIIEYLPVAFSQIIKNG